MSKATTITASLAGAVCCGAIIAVAGPATIVGGIAALLGTAALGTALIASNRGGHNSEYAKAASELEQKVRNQRASLSGSTLLTNGLTQEFASTPDKQAQSTTKAKPSNNQNPKL